MLIRSFYIEWEQFEYKKCCFSYANWPRVGKQILYVRSLFTIVVSSLLHFDENSGPMILLDTTKKSKNYKS